MLRLVRGGPSHAIGHDSCWVDAQTNVRANRFWREQVIRFALRGGCTRHGDYLFWCHVAVERRARSATTAADATTGGKATPAAVVVQKGCG
jgi:hypothetical protein